MRSVFDEALKLFHEIYPKIASMGGKTMALEDAPRRIRTLKLGKLIK